MVQRYKPSDLGGNPWLTQDRCAGLGSSLYKSCLLAGAHFCLQKGTTESAASYYGLLQTLPNTILMCLVRQLLHLNEIKDSMDLPAHFHQPFAV